MTRRVILAGGGHAHLAVLADWARAPLPGTQRWLVTSSRFTAYSGMLPGWLAGIYQAHDLLIDLKPLAERAGAQLILADVVGLDPARRTLSLSSGEEMGFDLLSLAIGGETDTSALAASGDRLLPVRPVGAFMARWSNLLEVKTLAPVINVAVVGGGAAGVELALGVDVALRKTFRSYRVSLVTPSDGFLSGHAAQVHKLAIMELADRGIAVHFTQAAGEENGLLLASGNLLPADCIIAATGSRAPRWLAQSGLACNEQGFVAVGADLRSTSHTEIFAAGDIIDRTDRKQERSGVHAVKAGPVLAANLRAAISNVPLQRYQPRNRTLYLLALGNRRAIASWGGIVTSSGMAWQLKNWIDRLFVERHRTTMASQDPWKMKQITWISGFARPWSELHFHKKSEVFGKSEGQEIIMEEIATFDRHKLEIFNWPALMQHFGPMAQLCLGGGELSRQLKQEAFLLLSLASGCRHCQAHGGYGLHLAGVPAERIQALWEFERSDQFSDAERAIYYFAMAAGASPNAVTPEHYASLRRHYSDQQITELLGVVAMSGFLNRYSDTLAVVTDQESVDWAASVLGPVGWSQGKHTGSGAEQRAGFPHMREN